MESAPSRGHVARNKFHRFAMLMLSVESLQCAMFGWIIKRSLLTQPGCQFITTYFLLFTLVWLIKRNPVIHLTVGSRIVNYRRFGPVLPTHYEVYTHNSPSIFKYMCVYVYSYSHVTILVSMLPAYEWIEHVWVGGSVCNRIAPAAWIVAALWPLTLTAYCL